jgi:FixJ family two-component response regulator
MVKKADNSRGQVFFVDDEPAVCAAVKDTLEKSHIPVRCFTHPAECLAQLRKGGCDVLIADLKMPEKNGMELLREVRDVAPWILVLIVTGYGDIPTAVTAMKCGAADFIEKPLGKDGFLQKVNGLLERSRMLHLDGFRALTQMEWNVLRLIIAGNSNSEIAAGIKRARRTIEAHRRAVMCKLGVHNLVELLKVATAAGLVDLPTMSDSVQGAPQIDDGMDGTREAE